MTGLCFLCKRMLQLAHGSSVIRWEGTLIKIIFSRVIAIVWSYSQLARLWRIHHLRHTLLNHLLASFPFLVSLWNCTSVYTTGKWHLTIRRQGIYLLIRNPFQIDQLCIHSPCRQACSHRYSKQTERSDAKNLSIISTELICSQHLPKVNVRWPPLNSWQECRQLLCILRFLFREHVHASTRLYSGIPFSLLVVFWSFSWTQSAVASYNKYTATVLSIV